MLPSSESLTIEFKSDRRCLPDRELIEAIVCLANTEGGTLYLGVEDDGTPTGLHKRHANIMGLGALIANRTVPPLIVQAELIHLDDITIARIDIPMARQIVATSDGVLKRRRLQLNGTPECVPFLPHEFNQRLSQLGLTDPTGQAVSGASLDDLDPVERSPITPID